jgi:cobalt transporter subunit CbtA
VATLAQAWWTTPLILQAERYEARAADPSAGSASGEMHSHPPAAADAGGRRFAMTLLTNGLTGIGFGLLLSGCLLLHGRAVGLVGGLVWGAAGFAVFALAPALGLPPELPGQAAADLDARQAWWLFATSATAAGLALLVLGPRWWLRPLGVVLLLLPHLAGAPHPPPPTGGPPPELIRQFITASLLTGALFWLVLGAAAGAINAWFLRREQAAPARRL